jgi:xylulose-5-phosphate/fructose-6-phosphate phosphoketolase
MFEDCSLAGTTGVYQIYLSTVKPRERLAANPATSELGFGVSFGLWDFGLRNYTRLGFRKYSLPCPPLSFWRQSTCNGTLMKTKETNLTNKPLTSDLLRQMNAYWRAANYLSVGQIYLYDNALLKKPLKREHIKPRLLGHWGTTPGLNFIYVHLNRVIKEHDLNMIYITGPGHGGPGLVANAYLEGTYSEVYPNISPDEEGIRRLFKQFSFPGGIPSHVAPETPGSIHEGGELGYSLSHACGAAFDNPDLLVACVVGDGEAETGPLATSWHSNKFLNPVHDGAVLPILHLNGYKIAGPTVLARIPRDELEALFCGYGYQPYFVEGDEPMAMHQLMAATLDTVVAEIRRIQKDARANGFKARPRWPMIILRSPKGWTGPKVVDGKPTEGTFRSHQVPMGEMSRPGHRKILEKWMRSYRPQELFDKTGRLRSELAELAPKGERRMSANPHANGGLLLRSLRLPDFSDYAVKVPKPGAVDAEATRVQGQFIRDALKLNPANFRVFSPDETTSNRWGAVFEVTNRCSTAEIIPGDEHVAPDGRVVEMLSEHQCEGWLEGYLLTGRHGFFSCYEAFIHIVDSMFNQHAKWLKVANHIPWRRPIASLNYLLSSHVWRQDHNGFSHQDPGFIDHVANKKAEIIRVYLPPDANTLLSVTDHCLRSRNYVNVIVAGKQPAPQWLDMDAAIKHCTAGIGIWPWASNDQGGEPDVVMACCGDVPTLETLAAVQLLRKHFPALKVRVINVVDLMKLQPPGEHPHGLSDKDFDVLFTKDKPIIFAYHGYPWLIHRLTYRRTNHPNLHVRGYKEEGTTTTPFDMTVMNDLDRFHLAADVIDRVPTLGPRAAYAKQALRDKLLDHQQYICRHGEDLPEIRHWKWSA